MDKAETITKKSKHGESWIFGRIYSTWLLPLYFKGLRRELKISDLCKSPNSDESELLADKLEKNWNIELKKSNPSFARASVKTFGLYLLPTFILFLFEECVLRNVQALMLARVIHFFANPIDEDYLYASLSAATVVGASFFYVLCHHPACYLAVRVAIKARVSWCTLMYRKALRLNHSAFGHTTIGQILNLMSNDVSRLDEFCIIGSYMIVAPIQTCIGMYICYLYLGPVCFIGLGILFLFIPSNSFTGRIFLKLRTKVATLSDTRIRVINEIIKGMRVIKMYAWEKHFSALISEARRQEMAKIRNATFLRALNISISVVSGRIILFAIFITYVVQGNTLNADKVFVVMSVINTVRLTMTWMFPNSIALLSELSVSCQRVQTFLMLDEIESTDSNKSGKPNKYLKTNVPVSGSKLAISVNNLSVKWDPNHVQPSLNDITVSLKQGELLAVIGSVGSGKSTFLMSLMNEIDILNGTININGRIAYASQEPWSFNGSVLQNIMFGKEFDSIKYKNVIDVCAMKRDIKLFPFGERTLVGERGVALSGGQKARITLARALYNDADIYLLDDPLSAVDSEFIKKASKILVLKEGKQYACGTYDELTDAGIDLISLIQKPDKPTDGRPTFERQTSVSSQLSISRNRTLSIISAQSEVWNNQTKKVDNRMVMFHSIKQISVDIDADFDPVVDEEDKGKGSISGRIYVQYVKAGSGTFLMIAMLLSTFISQFMFHFTDVWLSNWTNEEDSMEHSKPTDESTNTMIYSSLIIGQFVAMIIRSATFFTMCIYASVNLHNRIFYCLMRAPISFFDANPTGRILNRFTKDIGIIDEQLPLAAYDLNLVIGTIIVVALSQWYLIFPALIMVAMILIVRAAYIKTARELKRFEGMARSPIYNQMTLTLNGLATIRAFEAQSLFIDQYYHYQNDHTATYFMCFASSRLLGLCMDIICIAYISCVAIFLMIFYQGIPSGTAGLALSMALGLTGMTQWGVRQSAEVENHMTSVERVIEYSNLEPEAELESLYKFPKNWPETGSVKFERVYLTYANCPEPVLKNLTFDIRGGEKIGVVGRTGAGKSSILAALFRMVEIQGKISIDGVDCSVIGLHELRKKMSIIPQEPMAFIGTLRKNLDPFDDHDDEQIWSALEEVQLKNAVLEMPGQLDYVLSEGGGNLSVGQRQLICLARALLRRNKILVLDEATANVDHRTDALIQRTIRHNFSQCTVITIAHRLNTIIDSDRVLVLDAGRVIQYDTPYNLLQVHSGIFYHLVQQTGKQMAAKLTAAATDSNNNVRGIKM
ncbi:hypothetical protein RDWZM_007406 [Blomia tropicalis]|uniref:Multidrug resistance-associated protein lethal(2)03659 n=1 Tax=Blomia tropicalis TaxID=40697 RepID=A0A9Q0RJ02_BLOTA|nr:hypothetical protein RDWZM_007406 [Blomia tropicalis]